MRDQLQIIASRYGETGTSPYLLPISVDGLIVVASISLVELAGRIRNAETTPAEPTPTTVIVPDRPAPTSAPPPPIPIAPELVAAARSAAAEHHRRTGRDITRDTLRDRLRVSNALAGELLRTLRREEAHP